MSAGGRSHTSSSTSSRANSRASSATSGTTLGDESADLPSSSYDGTHLHWKNFRRDVLAAHRIRVLEGPPSHPLPESLIALIEATSADAGRFRQQKHDFRQQVTQGRGFGPSPLFPPNLLPSIEHEPQLARCMVPCFNREALPERVPKHTAPLYELSVPRSGLGCGFSSGAFTADELSKAPRHLVATGTVVEFNTGYISSGVSLYAPFLVFERTFGQKEYRLEAANNQCAIAGAWCVRSMQMLYTRAWSTQSPSRPDPPVSFSCTIDNDIAIVNYHWIDHAQSYCMSPVCKFDLTNDEHFHQFSVWIEAIGQWGLRTLLPIFKNALALTAKPPHLKNESVPYKPTKLRLNTVLEEEKLVTALKTTFGSIPWRTEDDEFTPVSSSVASWGSPILQDIMHSTMKYLPVSRGKSFSAGATTGDKTPKEMSQKCEAPIIPLLKQNSWKVDTPLTPQAFSPTSTRLDQFPKVEVLPVKEEMYCLPLPKSTVNTELVWQKRFGHAINEIQHLHSELERLKQMVNGSSTNLQNELSGIKNTISCVMRKETTTLRTRTPASGMPGAWTHGQHELFASRHSTDLRFVTSPTDASPRGTGWDFIQKPAKRATSGLHQVMTVDTGVAKTISNRSTPCSPAIISPAISIRSDITNIVVVPPPAAPNFFDIFKWSTVLFSTHMVGSFIPSTALRIAFLGCVTDFAMLAWASPHWASTTAYFFSMMTRKE